MLSSECSADALAMGRAHPGVGHFLFRQQPQTQLRQLHQLGAQTDRVGVPQFLIHYRIARQRRRIVVKGGLFPCGACEPEEPDRCFVPGIPSGSSQKPRISSEPTFEVSKITVFLKSM
jgi:hypothetical protein